MILREANKHDTPQIIALVKAGLREFGFRYAPESSESDLLDIHQSYAAAGGTFLVILDDHQLVATGALKKIDKLRYKIRKMYVDQAYRGQGFGRQILEALLQVAHDRGAQSVRLETSRRMKAAIRLYQRFGFKEVTTSAESPRCDICMVLDLSKRALSGGNNKPS